MSNQAVGEVYRKIIEEVLEASKQDFEEAGVDESVIAELRQVCSCLSGCRPVIPACVIAFPPVPGKNASVKQGDCFGLWRSMASMIAVAVVEMAEVQRNSVGCLPAHGQKEG